MRDGIEVVDVEDDLITISFSDLSLKGPTLAALLQVVEDPRQVEKISRLATPELGAGLSYPRVVYRVPATAAQAAGLLVD